MFTANDKRQIQVKNFLELKNKQIKTVQKKSYVQNWRETTCFLSEVINS